MKNLGLILTFLASCNFQIGFAQDNDKVDSLLKKIEQYDIQKKISGKQDLQIKDSVKAIWYKLIAQEFWDNTPSKNIKYSKDALFLSKKINYKIGIGNSYRSIGLAYENLKMYDSANEYYLNSLNAFEECDYIKGKAATLGDLANLSLHLRKYNDVLYYNDQSIELSKSINNKSGIAIALTNQAIIYRRYGNYIRALDCINQALKLLESTNDELELANCYFQKANVYLQWARDLNNYSSIEHYNQAIKYYKDSKRTYWKLKNDIFVAYCDDNIGNCLNGQGQYDQAIIHYKLALEIRQKKPFPNHIEESYFNLANALIITNDLKEAEEYLKKAENPNIDSANIDFKFEMTRLYGELYTKKGNLKEAQVFFLKGYAYSISYHDTLKEILFLKELSDNYGSLGEFSKAYQYLKLHLKLKEKIYNTQNENNIRYAVNQEEFDKKKEAEIAIREEKEDNKITLLYALLLCLIFFIILIVYFIKRYFLNFIVKLAKEFIQPKHLVKTIRQIKNIIKTFVLIWLFLFFELLNILSHHFSINILSLIGLAFLFHIFNIYITKYLDDIFKR